MCRRQLVELAQYETEFAAHNTSLVAIAVQDVAGAAHMADAVAASYPILADADHRVAETYEVYNILNDGVAAPAAFILNTHGEIIWSYVGQNLNDRPPATKILAQLP